MLTPITIENHNQTHNQTHNRKSQPQPRPTTRPTLIEQRGSSEQKGKKKTGEEYRSVMVETKLMVAHIHEREDNRATGKTHNQTNADITERTERTKGGKKTGEGYRSVMVETILMLAHIHEWEEIGRAHV